MQAFRRQLGWEGPILMNGKLPDPSLLLLPEDMASIPLEGHTQKDTILETVNPLQTPNLQALLSWVCYLAEL